MQQITPDELSDLQRHFLLCFVRFVVLSGKGDAPVLERQKPLMTNGDTVGISPRILNHLFWASKRTFGIDHPRGSIQGSDPFLKSLFIGERCGGAAVRKTKRGGNYVVMCGQ